MKPQLALVKFRLESQEEVFQIASIMERLAPSYQISLVLIESEHDFSVPSIPIFSGQDLIEFHCPILALDLLATKYVKIAAGSPKLYYPLSPEFGRPDLEEKTIDEIYDILALKETENEKQGSK